MMNKMERLLEQLNPGEMYLVDRWKKKAKADDAIRNASPDQQAASLAISLTYFYRKKALEARGGKGGAIEIWNIQRGDRWREEEILNGSDGLFPLFEKGDFDTVYDFETQYKR